MRDISLTKRILAIGLAATVLGGGIIGIPVNVLAQNYSTSDDLISATGDNDVESDVSVEQVTENGPIDDNYGSVTTNNGTINRNRGSVTTNNGTIVDNNATGTTTGTVDTNNNLISENYGQVNTNSTTGVVHNTYNGTVISNHGTVTFHIGNSSVTDNYSDGTVNSEHYSYGGTIVNNFGGTVGNYPLITVTNNFDTGNYGLGSLVQISNQYWSVSVAEITNGSATLSGFLHKDQTDKDYLRDKDDEATDCKSGTITISPSEGHEIVGNEGTIETTNCTYTIAKSGNNYVITISGVDGTVANLTLAQLDLAIREIQNNNENGGASNVVIRVDDSIRITDDRSTPQAPQPIYSAASTISAAQISSQIEKAIATNPSAAVIDINLGNEPSLDAAALIALCEKNNVAKRCHFTHDGMKFILYIPVIDVTSDSFKQCMAMLDLEPGKQAGPIRLSLLFAPVGFSVPNE